MASVLSSDGKQDPDVMAANATSTALMLSDIPWGGPVGMIRLGRIDGKLIINPSIDEVEVSFFSTLLCLCLSFHLVLFWCLSFGWRKDEVK